VALIDWFRKKPKPKPITSPSPGLVNNPYTNPNYRPYQPNLPQSTLTNVTPSASLPRSTLTNVTPAATLPANQTINVAPTTPTMPAPQRQDTSFFDKVKGKLSNIWGTHIVSPMYGFEPGVTDEYGNPVLTEEAQEILREKENRKGITGFARNLVPIENGYFTPPSTGNPILDLISIGAVENLPLELKGTFTDFMRAGDSLLKRGVDKIFPKEYAWGPTGGIGRRTFMGKALTQVTSGYVTPQKILMGIIAIVAGAYGWFKAGAYAQDPAKDVPQQLGFAIDDAMKRGDYETAEALQQVINDSMDAMLDPSWGIIAVVKNYETGRKAFIEKAEIVSESYEKQKRELSQKNKEYITLIQQAWGTEGGYNRLINDTEFQTWITQHWNTEASRLYEAFQKDVQRRLNQQAYGGTGGGGGTINYAAQRALETAQRGAATEEPKQREEPSTLTWGLLGKASEYTSLNKDRAAAMERFKGGTANDEDLALVLYGVPLNRLTKEQKQELANWK